MSHRNDKADSRASLRLLTLSMVIFGTIGIFRRSIPLPSDALAFGRGILGGVFLLLLLRIRGKGFSLRSIPGRSFLLLVLTGAMIGFNWILLFEAYVYTTVATATLCYYMEPVIVTVLSPLLLKEKLTAGQAACAAVSLLGMVLVSGVIGGTGTASVPDNGRGILLGLGAAALYASVVLLNKYLPGVPAFERTVIQLFSASAVLIPYMAATGTLRAYPLTAVQVALFVTVGIVHTGIAYAMYFAAMEGLSARTCALLSYIDPVSAVILSALLLREPMTLYGIIGAVLILGSAVLSGQLEG